jgi:Glycosyl transferase family 8
MVFFTSVTSNYLPKAAILADSVRKHMPGASFYLLLNDTPPADFARLAGSFTKVFRLEDLRLSVENVDQWLFQHTVVELCTAVKGPFLLQILEQMQADKVVYMDPDIVVLDHLKELESLLDSHSVIVTPHLAEPEESLAGIIDNEICVLKHGIFNLGFLAVRNSPEGLRFARWWSERLTQFCYDDIPDGLFTDQRWMDLAPCLFTDFYILREKAYNIATWNLSHRPVERRADGELYVDGARVKFFHFSGFDSGHQLIRLNHYREQSPALFELRDWYVRELERAGQARLGALPWGYAFFSNGQPIQNEHRRFYRRCSELMADFPQPALVEAGKKSYYRWCVKNFKNGKTPIKYRLPLLQRWKRSIKKRVKYLPKAAQLRLGFPQT